MRLEFHTSDEASAFNSLYLVSLALGWFDLCGSRCFQFWLYVRTKPKGFIGGVHYIHDFPQACLILGSSVSLPGGDQVDGLPPAPSKEAKLGE